MDSKHPAATPLETIDALLTRSKRSNLPLRQSFVQQGRGKSRSPGPAAAFLTRRDPRALDLYLLIHAVASAEPYDVTLPAATWARALNLSIDKTGNATKSSRTAVSKALARLEKLQLITRSRKGKRSCITILDEGGHGEPYKRPATRYFKLPYDYWREEWHLKLVSSEKFVLLVSLSLKDGFPLPAERAPDWYGVSADSVQKGLSGLRQHGLLQFESIPRKAPLAPRGFTEQRLYTLQPPFGPHKRIRVPEKSKGDK